MLKKILASVLIVCLSIGMLYAFAVTPSEEYEDALNKLSYYLTYFSDAERGNDVSLQEIYNEFNGLGGYSYSGGFKAYIELLMLLENGNYRREANYKGTLNGNPQLNALETDKEFQSKYPAIRPVSELLHYTDGRIAENAGRKYEARKAYEKCTSFYDSLNPNVALEKSLLLTARVWT